MWQHVLKKRNIKDVGLEEQKKDCMLHRLLEAETVLTPASLWYCSWRSLGPWARAASSMVLSWRSCCSLSESVARVCCFSCSAWAIQSIRSSLRHKHHIQLNTLTLGDNSYKPPTLCLTWEFLFLVCPFPPHSQAALWQPACLHSSFSHHKAPGWL